MWPTLVNQDIWILIVDFFAFLKNMESVVNGSGLSAFLQNKFATLKTN